jgi:hypothetical protein
MFDFGGGLKSAAKTALWMVAKKAFSISLLIAHTFQ